MLLALLPLVICIYLCFQQNLQKNIYLLQLSGGNSIYLSLDDVGHEGQWFTSGDPSFHGGGRTAQLCQRPQLTTRECLLGALFLRLLSGKWSWQVGSPESEIQIQRHCWLHVKRWLCRLCQRHFADVILTLLGVSIFQ